MSDPSPQCRSRWACPVQLNRSTRSRFALHASSRPRPLGRRFGRRIADGCSVAGSGGDSAETRGGSGHPRPFVHALDLETELLMFKSSGFIASFRRRTPKTVPCLSQPVATRIASPLRAYRSAPRARPRHLTSIIPLLCRKNFARGQPGRLVFSASASDSRSSGVSRSMEAQMRTKFVLLLRGAT